MQILVHIRSEMVVETNHLISWTWISNYMSSTYGGAISCPFPKFHTDFDESLKFLESFVRFKQTYFTFRNTQYCFIVLVITPCFDVVFVYIHCAWYKKKNVVKIYQFALLIIS